MQFHNLFVLKVAYFISFSKLSFVLFNLKEIKILFKIHDIYIHVAHFIFNK